MGIRSKWEEPENLPQALAYCTIRRALRPFLRRDSGFVACFVVDPEHASTYQTVAESILLRRNADGFRSTSDRASVTTFMKGDATRAKIQSSLQRFRRVVLIFSRDISVPENLKASCEVFQIVNDPDPALMRSALAKFYGRPWDIEDESIIRANWNDLATVFRKGRSPRQSAARLKAMMRDKCCDAVRETPAVNAEAKLRALDGYGEASAWGLELARDLAAYKAGTIEWSDVERGLLLFGRPGTGKTTFGRKLAGYPDSPPKK